MEKTKRKREPMSVIAELYKCTKCNHIENEHPGKCPECDGKMECVDFVMSTQLVECYDAGLADGKRQFAAELDELRGWKREVEEACIVDWVPVTTPKETISNLISWNIKMALDPVISKDANDLLEKGKGNIKKDLAAVLVFMWQQGNEINKNMAESIREIYWETWEDLRECATTGAKP